MPNYIVGKEEKERVKELLERRSIPIPETGCWIWEGATSGTKPTHLYGHLGVKTEEGSWKTFYAHRLSYLIHKGAIPEGHYVCHSCDEPLCVNPEHLFVGTQQDNVNDMLKKNRGDDTPLFKSGENHYKAKLSEEDVTYIRANLTGWGSVAKLARKFGVTPGNISSIKHNRIWKIREAV